MSQDYYLCDIDYHRGDVRSRPSVFAGIIISKSAGVDYIYSAPKRRQRAGRLRGEKGGILMTAAVRPWAGEVMASNDDMMKDESDMALCFCMRMPNSINSETAHSAMRMGNICQTKSCFPQMPKR